MKGRHKVCGDLCRFLFSDGVGGILLSGFEKVFQRTAVLGRAPVSKQFDRHGWNRQQEVINIVARWRMADLT